LDALVLELEDVLAAGADQVVMVVAVESGLVAGLPALEVAHAGQTRLGEDLHRPVDGGGADAGIAPARFLHQLLDAEVPRLGKEGINDHVALPGSLEPPLGDPRRQPEPGRLDHHFSLRDSPHIEIDSQLQSSRGAPADQPPRAPSTPRTWALKTKRSWRA